ncbi:MAG: 3-deoxy-8-phosphooctulonate synthase [Deltaproteobacteria bacterium]
MKRPRALKIGDVALGSGRPFVLIAGPCVIESADSAWTHAKRLKEICARAGVPFIFKSSYDKANRTSLRGFRGPGAAKGLKILARIRKELSVPVLSDVHTVEEAAAAGEVLDVLQIPAFLCRQTDLLVAAAKTQKAVNIKKGQFMAPWDMAEAVRKVAESGNGGVLLTERGTSFGYNNLVVDFRGLAVMRELGVPVVFDATHSVQLPGGRGRASGGERRHAAGLARAALAFGVDGIFVEVHEDPDAAPCDGPNMISLKELEAALPVLKALDALAPGKEAS